MEQTNYSIDVNFLPIVSDIPNLVIFRKLFDPKHGHRSSSSEMIYHLPESSEQKEEWPLYRVSMSQTTGFEEFHTPATTNHHLTVRILYRSLIDAANGHLSNDDFFYNEKGFYDEVSFVQHRHFEGNEILLVQPYYLRATQQFGLLADFRFRLKEGIEFSRRVQQLSLSLDQDFRRNLDYYADRLEKIMQSINDLRHVFNSLKIPNSDSTITVHREFVRLSADRLRSKIYVFSDNRESRGQFLGLKTHGPLQSVDGPFRLLFVFREQDRIPARRLAMSLRGSRSHERFSFPGFRRLFGCDPVIDSDPVLLPDLSRNSIEQALERTRRDMSIGNTVVPIIVLPTEDDNAYMVQKSLFSHSEIATQVCTLQVLEDQGTLRWAISNIALQIFCKAGGIPWKVRPSGKQSLIIGVSQSHKLRRESDGRVRVERYLAFSVMTDNSGLFQKIQVLSESDNENDYFRILRKNLGALVDDGAQNFSSVIVHTSFRLKRREIAEISRIVTSSSAAANLSCRFAVVKINHRTKFFGVNRAVNSLVPYEATRVRLGHGEYLLWFEGIFPDKTTVTKPFPGPTHIQIVHPDDKRRIPEDLLLQDLVNLSGANWRGFNAKSTPVSVFYCHLVANFVHDFRDHDLPLPAVSDIRPWFL